MNTSEMNSSSSEQDWHLYNVKWNEALDSYLISRLMEREKECHPIPPVDSPHALICAMEALNKELDADLSYADVRKRVEFLRIRYTCFKKLASRIETDWDATNNRIFADEAVWKVIFAVNLFRMVNMTQMDPLARAYYKQGEPHWFKLCRLFGWTDIKKEASPTVIVISDSPHALYSCASTSEGEVTSPVLKPSTARKLLFEDDAHSSIGPSHAWTISEGKIGFPPPNTFPNKPLDCSGTGKDIEQSSCASSSPCK